MILYYKIVRKEKGQLKTLHHAINGSRVLSVNKWITAEKRDVKDSTKGTPYKCGLHVVPSLEEAKSYMKHFKNTENLLVVPVQVTGLRRKNHSRHIVYLANKIKIIKL